MKKIESLMEAVVHLNPPSLITGDNKLQFFLSVPQSGSTAAESIRYI